MRPPKNVLIIDTDEERASILVFVLKTHHYSVEWVGSNAEALDASAERCIDLAIISVDARNPHVTQLLEELFEISPSTRIVLLYENAQALNRAWCFHTSFQRDQIRMDEFLQRMRILAARKRGPEPAGYEELRMARLARRPQARRIA